jgi:phosphatidylserine decarboxylase
MGTRYWNRAEGKEEEELVYGDAFIQLLYGNSLGFAITDSLLTRSLVSKLYGSLQSSSLSRKKIAPFIENLSIHIDEFEPGPFPTYNDFFIRRFRPGKRVFASDASRMPAFAEARYYAFPSVTEKTLAPIKGLSLSPLALLENIQDASSFVGGPAFLARLCPVDYHRFHYPDDGVTLSQTTVHGRLHSVNPLALQQKPDIFLTNERSVSILETKNFGKLAYVEVGALCVGKIVQSHTANSFQRGAEKGYFLFGGSTVIVVGEPGRWTPDQDILDRTAAGEECLIRLGEAIAKRNS